MPARSRRIRDSGFFLIIDVFVSGYCFYYGLLGACLTVCCMCISNFVDLTKIDIFFEW